MFSENVRINQHPELELKHGFCFFSNKLDGHYPLVQHDFVSTIHMVDIYHSKGMHSRLYISL
jgi:hypothetical protein